MPSLPPSSPVALVACFVAFLVVLPGADILSAETSPTELEAQGISNASALEAVRDFAEDPGPTSVAGDIDAIRSDDRFRELALARLEGDVAAMKNFRPGYAFWQHIFMIPDGSVAYGSAEDGRLLVVFPTQGDWNGRARWEDASLASVIRGQRLESRVAARRDQVAELMEVRAGPVLHNATRGNFLIPNSRRYGSFLEEWGHIYERFGVPAEVGLAQAILESGLNGTIRSEAGAIGFCQWMPRNWNRMKQLAPYEIEGHNQTTQAPYCAAYLTILATKYGSFIPALSEHHAGGTNVGRTVINGARLGGESTREQYFLGSEFARDLRTISSTKFRQVVQSYGPRSFLYAEMVFGNTANVTRLRSEIPQVRIHAMRAPRNIPLADISQRTGLSVDEIRRYNPALIRQVPRGANLYLPRQVDAFGQDVAFWHRDADPAYAAVLADFLRMDATVEQWENPNFSSVLMEYRRRFSATGTEEGSVMATVLTYVMEESYTSRRPQILAEYRTDPNILRLVNEGVRERAAFGSSVNAR